MMAGIAVRAGTSLTDRDDSSLPPAGRTARTPRRASPSLLHDSALSTAPTTHAKTPIPSSSDQETLNSSSMSTPTGTKLAVTTTCDSPAGGEEDKQDLLESDSCFDDKNSDKDTQSKTSAIKIKSESLEIEKEIALSQLQELEVAIKVRKVSKVDGRKVRWIEYRARKAEEEKNNNGPKTKRRSRRSKTSENDENVPENVSNINNNNNNNNNNSFESGDDTDSMKGEVISTPLVLESMKLQFLQGTENIDGSIANGNGEVGLHKSPEGIQKRKSSRTRKSQGTPKENKEVKSSPPKSTPKSTPKGKSRGSTGGGEGPENKSGSNLKKLALNGSSEILSKIENVSTEDIPSIVNTTPAMSPVKVSTPASSPISDDVPLSSLRPTFKSLTKGLREIRKTENGVDADPSKGENDGNSLTVDTGTKFDVKCLPMTPLSPLLLTPSPREKSAESIVNCKRRSVTPKKTKAALSKSAERASSAVESISNGHQDLQNGSPKENVLPLIDTQILNKEHSLDKLTPKEDTPETKVKRRGRPPKRKLSLANEDRKVSPLGKSSKKVETVVVDVHNTMNGEPQTVIPISQPILRGKKASPTKKKTKGKQKVAASSVDALDIISVKSSNKKSTLTESVGRVRDKSQPETKKKVSGPRKKAKKANAALHQENVEASATPSASVSNQTQATHKSKSTKPLKGVTSELLSPVTVNEVAPINPPKASPQSDLEVSIAKNESKKGKQTGKAEKSLSGRVIRRAEVDKSPNRNETVKRSPLSKGQSSLKEVSATKGSSAGKGSSVQKSSNIQRSISIEKLVPFAKTDKKAEDTETQQKIKLKGPKASEELSLRKASSVSTESVSPQLSLVEDLGKKGQRLGLSLSSVGRSKTSPSILVTNKGRQLVNVSENVTGKSKSLKSGKEDGLRLQEVVTDEDVVALLNSEIAVAPKKTQKKGMSSEKSSSMPQKILESKIGTGLSTEESQVREGIKDPPLDVVHKFQQSPTKYPSTDGDQLDKVKYVDVKQKEVVPLIIREVTGDTNTESIALVEFKEKEKVEFTDQQTDVPKSKSLGSSEVAVEGEVACKTNSNTNSVPVQSEKDLIGDVISDNAKDISGEKQASEVPEVTNSSANISENQVKDGDAIVAGLKDDGNNFKEREGDAGHEKITLTEVMVTKTKENASSNTEEKVQVLDDIGEKIEEKLEDAVNACGCVSSSSEMSLKKFDSTQVEERLHHTREISSNEGERNISKDVEAKDQVTSDLEVTTHQYNKKQSQSVQHVEEIKHVQESTKRDVEELSVTKNKSAMEIASEHQSWQNSKVSASVLQSLQQVDSELGSVGPEDKDAPINIKLSTSFSESSAVVENDETHFDKEVNSVCDIKEVESRSNKSNVYDVSKQPEAKEMSTKVFYAKNKSKRLLSSNDNNQQDSDFDKDGGVKRTFDKEDINERNACVDAVEAPTFGETVLEGTITDAVSSSATDQGGLDAQGSLAGKSKEKVPRILKQLFQDEGVQNMLKSMSDESGPVPEGSPNEAGTHKLRPKRPTEPMLASSPELDGIVDALFSTTKKRKRWSELDSLYMDEGVLHLLTSIDSPSRRTGQDDAASDISQASSSRSVKTNKSNKSSTDLTSESRKRKLSGASTLSNTSTKSMQPPEFKKICLDQSLDVKDPYDYNVVAEETLPPLILSEERTGKREERDLTPVPKKKGRPTVSLSVKQKNKAIKMQLKIQKQKQMKGDSIDPDGVNKEEDELNLADLREELRRKSIDPDGVNKEEDELNLADLREELRRKSTEKKDEENLNLVELQGVLRKEKTMSIGTTEKTSTLEALSSKSIPPLKIRLSDSVTISPITKLDIQKQSVPSGEITKTLSQSQRPPQPQPRPQPHFKQHLQPRPQLQHRSTSRLSPHSQSQSQPRPQLQQRQFVSGASNSAQAMNIRNVAQASTSTAKVPVVQPRRTDSPVTPPLGIPSLVPPYEFGGQGRGRPRIGETVRQSQRASVRQSEANHHYRDISLRKFNNFTQIILSPSTTKMKNALNSRVLRELCEALNILKRDDTVRMVLLTGTGSTFCQGIDLTALQHPNIDTRKKNAENLVRGIKEFLRTLVQFPKPIVAGVNGNAMGLGVTMLPLFDLVIANDKAEFYLPYAKLGQIPEGGATYTFPNLFGKLKSTQLFLGHKVTASMALEMGLASESIWPATYQQELIPKVALLATQSAQSMEATKALMNHHLITKLELSLESECRLLLQHWTSPHFAHLCKRFLDTHHIHLQKPVNLPL